MPPTSVPNQQHPGHEYLRTKATTASPEQLRLMLFDGAIKFCRQASHSLAHNDFEQMYNGLVKAQKIVMELNSSLDRDADPQLCDRMASLYNYMHRRMVDANMERDQSAIDEVLRLLEYERETWQMLINKLQSEQDSTATQPTTSDTPTNPIASIGPDNSSETSSPATGGFTAEG